MMLLMYNFLQFHYILFHLIDIYILIFIEIYKMEYLQNFDYFF